MRICLFFLYYFVVLLGPALVYKRPTGQVTLDFSAPLTLFVALVSSFITLVVGYSLAWKSTYLPTQKPWSNRLLVWSIFNILCLLGTNGIITLLTKLLGMHSQNNLTINLSIGPMFILIILLCIVIGYAEEALFRRAARTIFWWMQGMSPHIVMSILFGAAHINQGWTAVIFSTIAGGIFATFYEILTKRYGKWGWHAVAISHGVYNLIILILAGWLGI